MSKMWEILQTQKGDSSFDFPRKCDCGGLLKYQETFQTENMEEKEKYMFWIGIAAGAISAFLLFFFFKLLIAPLIGES